MGCVTVFFYNILINGIAGTALFCLWCLLKRRWERKGQYRTIFSGLKAVVLSFLLPFGWLCLTVWLYDWNAGGTADWFPWLYADAGRIALVLFALWLPGVLLQLARYLRELCLLRIFSREAELVEGGEEAERFHDLLREMGIRRSIRLYRTPLIASPMAAGFWHSRIFLPDKQYSEYAWRVILVHELTHVKQGDLRWKNAAAAVEVLFWFHPLVYRLFAELDSWAELNCDIACAVSGAVGSERAYYEAILAELTENREIRRRCSAALFESETTLKWRIRKMLNYKRARASGKRAAPVLACLFLLACPLFAAASGTQMGRVYRQLEEHLTLFTEEQQTGRSETEVYEAADFAEGVSGTSGSETAMAGGSRYEAAMAGQGMSWTAISGQSASEEPVSEEAVSEEALSEEAVPEESLSVEAVPEESLSGESTSEASVSEESVVTAALESSGSFGGIVWELDAGGLMQTASFSLTEGQVITLSAAAAPEEAEVRIGLCREDGSKRYIAFSGRASCDFEITQGGKYRIFVENKGEVPITVEFAGLGLGLSSAASGTGTVENLSGFPERYQATKGNVTFDCVIEADDAVRENGANRMEWSGYYYPLTKVALKLFADGKELMERHGAGSEAGWGSLYYTDGSHLNIGAGFGYTAAEWDVYSEIELRSDWEGRAQERLIFAGPEDCIEEIQGWMEQLGVPPEHFHFTWYSVSAEEMQKQEEANLQQGLLSEEKAKGVWSEADEVYVIYGWQYEQEIPVFHELMSMYEQFALDTPDNAAVSAIYNANGLVAFAVQRICYDLTETDEPVRFLAFEEVARTVAEKYSSLLYGGLLSDTHYTVERARLFWMVHRKNGEMTVEPIWRFEIDGGTSRTLVTLVNAETGKEIPLSS